MPVKRSVANNEEEEKETHKNKIHRLVANPDGKNTKYKKHNLASVGSCQLKGQWQTMTRKWRKRQTGVGWDRTMDGLQRRPTPTTRHNRGPMKHRTKHKMKHRTKHKMKHSNRTKHKQSTKTCIGLVETMNEYLPHDT